MIEVKEMLIEALDYAGARTGAGEVARGGIFAMAYRELINSIRDINAEPRYSFGYQIAKGVVSTPTLEIGRDLNDTGEWALATEAGEFILSEAGEIVEGVYGDVLDVHGNISLHTENNLDFSGLVPYRIARVYDGAGDYARTDRADVIRDRELNKGIRQFSFNQDREDFAILELSQIPNGELTVIAEKQIQEPDGYEDSLDMPRNVYKFLMSWLARSLCRRLGNAEMEPLAAAELAACEKPFIATNERNKRDYRINPRNAYRRLGAC